MITWNGIAAIAAFASLLTWIIQHFFKLWNNVLIREDRTKGGWSSEGTANIEHDILAVPSEDQPPLVRSSLMRTLFQSFTKYWMIQVRSDARAVMAAITFQVIILKNNSH